jgi:hypothetical protein
MALTIIVKNKLKSRGRSDYDKILRKEGWGGSMTEEQADKCEFMERKVKALGVDRETCFRATNIDKMK